VTELDAVLGAFHDATGCETVVWTQTEDGGTTIDASAPAGQFAITLPADAAGFPLLVNAEGKRRLVAPVPGPRRAWLAVGPCREDDTTLERYRRFLMPVVAQHLQAALEVEHAANELAERYEEINLLYTISEILGRTVTLEEAAATILTEISETVGARRASILVHDSGSGMLRAVAVLGAAMSEAPPIAADDQSSVSARVFRMQHPMLADRDEMLCVAEAPYRRGAMLSVPIMWTGSDGPEPLGVVNLSDRRAGLPFTAGDQKLVAAIATQIGSAIQNARLVHASLAQQRLAQEMELAHDLQMKLLPNVRVVAPEAQVAARVVPAESVGGDFYQLFRLSDVRTGAMIGDVSSHGYRAALIMALALSATAIHAQSGGEPGATLNALLLSMREELESTEMFITTFYGVIDREASSLRYANAGHPHAFVIGPNGEVDRLPALDPPLGMVDGPPEVRSHPWTIGQSLLLLFTDGISDARGLNDERYGEQPVLDLVREHRTRPVDEILHTVFEALQVHTSDLPQRDDETLLILRS